MIFLGTVRYTKFAEGNVDCVFIGTVYNSCILVSWQVAFTANARKADGVLDTSIKQ